MHGGMGYGRTEPDVEGERILEYALAFDLLLGNTCFKKRDSHLITYKSGNIATQTDFILFRRTMRKLVTDAAPSFEYHVHLRCQSKSQILEEIKSAKARHDKKGLNVYVQNK